MGGPEGLESILRGLAEKIWKDRRMGLETMTDSAESELIMSLGSTEAFPSREDPLSLVEGARKRASAFVAQWVEDTQQQRTLVSSRLLRLTQKAILVAPVVLLILKLLGPDHVGRWLEHPSLSTALMMMVSCLTSLFGSEGLIGLTALLLCEGSLIWYLGSRRLKKIDKMSRWKANDAVKLLKRRLDAVCESVQNQRTETLERIEEGLERLDAINAASLERPAWRNVEMAPKAAETSPESPALPAPTRVGSD